MEVAPEFWLVFQPAVQIRCEPGPGWPSWLIVSHDWPVTSLRSGIGMFSTVASTDSHGQAE